MNMQIVELNTILDFYAGLANTTSTCIWVWGGGAMKWQKTLQLLPIGN